MAESLAYSAEKTLRENEEKVDDDLKGRVEEAVKTVRGALEGDDAEAVSTATDELSQVMQEIGQAVYGGGDDGAAEGTADGAAAPEDAVDEEEQEGEAASTVEGEFREV